jgi:Holliday junction resolvase RusA-like endonuclease
MMSFRAQGIPKGQPRPRAFSRNGHARVFDPGTAEVWKSDVAAAACPVLPATPLTGPLVLRIDFFFPRPKNHYVKAGLRTGAPLWHRSKPDADNAAKAVMDALTTLGAWEDDAQVAQLIVRKYYAADAQNTGALVTVEALEEKSNAA